MLTDLNSPAHQDQLAAETALRTESSFTAPDLDDGRWLRNVVAEKYGRPAQ